jgi:ribosomal protein S1
VDKPSSLFKVGDVVEAEVTNVDSREKRIGLSIKALRKSEERAEMDAYLKRERDSGKFSFADVMPEAEKSKG